MTGIENKYLSWLLQFVADDGLKRRYRVLFERLFNTPFDHRRMKEFDVNRAQDGRNLIIRFEKSMGDVLTDIPHDDLLIFEQRGCSMLDMLIALSLRIEEGFAEDERQGNRTGLWFWEMLTNLGIGYMSNDRFDSREYERCIDIFHRYDYDPDGKGCLFRSRNKTIRELAELDIWYQMSAYAEDEFIDIFGGLR